MSAASRPVWGRAWREFSTFTAMTGAPSSLGATSPVRGHVGSTVGVGDGVGEGVGDEVVEGAAVGSGSSCEHPASAAVEATSTDMTRVSVRFIGLPRWEWTCPH